MKKLLILLSMRYVLLALLILSLNACTSSKVAVLSPTPFRTIGNTWAYKKRDHAPKYSVAPGCLVMVIGYVGDWWLSRAPNGEELFVPLAALVPETDSTTRSYIDAYYYPHRAGSPYAPGNGPSYSLNNGRETYIGPRGGEYYINGNGNRTYVTPQSTIDREPVQTGPRGGQYYINGNGNKTYIKH